MSDLFEEEDLALAGDAEERGRGRAGGVRARGMTAGAPPPAPGTWQRCVDGNHDLCLYELRVFAPWATAGLEAPDPFAEAATVERCACSCPHVGRAKTLDGAS